MRIKIEDLPKHITLSEEEKRKVVGGIMGGNSDPNGGFTGNNPGSGFSSSFTGNGSGVYGLMGPWG